MPTCPKCGKFITERHYERHLKRCGTEHHEERIPSQSVVRELEAAERGTGPHHPTMDNQTEAQVRATGHAPAEEKPRVTNWTKVAAYFVIFLLIGSTVVFFLLYFLSAI